MRVEGSKTMTALQSREKLMKHLINSLSPPPLPLTMLELMPESCARLTSAFKANIVWGKGGSSKYSCRVFH